LARIRIPLFIEEKTEGRASAENRPFAGPP
jgi:hypothetical protein